MCKQVFSILTPKVDNIPADTLAKPKKNGAIFHKHVHEHVHGFTLVTYEGNPFVFEMFMEMFMELLMEMFMNLLVVFSSLRCDFVFFVRSSWLVLVSSRL